MTNLKDIKAGLTDALPWQHEGDTSSVGPAFLFKITTMRTIIVLFLLLAAIIFSGCTKAADTTTLRATGYCWTCELQVTPTTTEVRDTCMSDNTYPRWTNEHGYIPQVKCIRK